MALYRVGLDATQACEAECQGGGAREAVSVGNGLIMRYDWVWNLRGETDVSCRAELGPVESEMPKGIARVLGAEGVRAAYRARRAREKEGKELRVLAGEGLGALNRLVESCLTGPN